MTRCRIGLAIEHSSPNPASGEAGRGWRGERADRALYAAKAAGRNQAQIHDGQQSHAARQEPVAVTSS
jgi:GGDEF domain-containing protein